MDNEDKSKRTAGIFYLILIQVVSRGLTFIGNQALLRFVSPQHLGLAVQLEALSISVLYTARESLRVALQRAPQSKSTDAKAKIKSLQGALNAAWLVVLLGFLLGALFGTIYLNRASTELLGATQFMTAFWLYGVATILELVSEPCFVIIQQNSLFKTRARAETLAAIARCVTACSTAVFMYYEEAQKSVLPFAVGQIFYGFVLCAAYYWNTSTITAINEISLFPRKIPEPSDAIFSFFPRPLLNLAGAFYGQSIFKWLLTQGDTLVLSLFAGLQSQGIFALASNYGGLASRLLFQPIEESSRNIFGSLLNTGGKTVANTNTRSISPEVVQRRQRALDHLATTLHLYIIGIAFPCVTLLPKIFPIIIQLLLGTRSQWNSVQTSALLSAYSYYLPCLAVNGVLDAFVTSAATEAELGAQSLMMVGVTMIYLSAAYVGMTVLDIGAVGLVYANIINMILRIAFSIWFLRMWAHSNLPQPAKPQSSPFRNFLLASLPDTNCFLTVAVSIFWLYVHDSVKSSLLDTTQTSEIWRKKLWRLDLDMYDLGQVVLIAVMVISSVLINEKHRLREVVEPLLPQRVKFLVKPSQPRQKTE